MSHGENQWMISKAQMILPDGEWTFEIVDSDIAYSPVTKSVDSENCESDTLLPMDAFT